MAFGRLFGQPLLYKGVFVDDDAVMIDSPSYIDQEQMDELFLSSTAERK